MSPRQTGSDERITASGRRKSSPAAIFSDETVFPCAKGAAGENGKETLLRKASEADAHVVSFGTRVGGLRPSDTSHRVYRQSVAVMSVSLPVLRFHMAKIRVLLDF